MPALPSPRITQFVPLPVCAFSMFLPVEVPSVTTPTPVTVTVTVSSASLLEAFLFHSVTK